MHDPQVQEFISFISAKWMYDIIYELAGGKKRFSELLEGIEGISNKMLSKRLNELIENEFCQKVVFSLVPLNIKYDLMQKGRDLFTLYQNMNKYANYLI